MYIVFNWPSGVAGGRVVPPDVREELGRGSIRPLSIGSSHCLTQYLQCLTTLVMGGNGLNRPGGNLGFSSPPKTQRVTVAI